MMVPIRQNQVYRKPNHIYLAGGLRPNRIYVMREWCHEQVKATEFLGPGNQQRVRLNAEWTRKVDRPPQILANRDTTGSEKHL